MIIDNIKNARLYYCLGERFEKALRFLQENDICRLEKGKHIIFSDEVYANIREYVTRKKEACMLEGHRKYADIQYIAKGMEYIGYSYIGNCTEITSYDEQKDLVFYEGYSQNILMSKDTFIILFPDDIHMPGICCGSPQQVIKVNMKVLI